MKSRSAEMKHSPWGPSTLPRLRACPGSHRAILQAKEAGKIPWEAPSKSYNEQGQKEHDACFNISIAADPDAAEAIREATFSDLLEGDTGAIDRVVFALDTVQDIINQVADDMMMDEPIVMFEEVSDPKHFFKTFAREVLPRLPEESLAGTCDVIIVDLENGVIYIIDYKFGYVDVKIENNDQFLGYAMGVVGKWSTKRSPPEKIVTVCIQPQAHEKVKKHTYTWDEFLIATFDYPEVIQKTLEEGAPLNPSAKNCMFCELDGLCQGQKEQCLATMREAPVEAMDSIDDEELGRLMNSVPLIKKWVKAIETQCLNRQIAGAKVPGRKLVRGTKHRKWVDPAKTLKFLAARGVKKDVREVVTPISPAQAAKALKKLELTKRAWTAFDKLWVKPEGALCSVPLDDPKTEVVLKDEVAAAFMEVDPDELPEEQTHSEASDDVAGGPDPGTEDDDDDDFI